MPHATVNADRPHSLVTHIIGWEGGSSFDAIGVSIHCTQTLTRLRVYELCILALLQKALRALSVGTIFLS